MFSAVGREFVLSGGVYFSFRFICMILAGNGEAGWSDWLISTGGLFNCRLILYDLMRFAG